MNIATVEAVSGLSGVIPRGKWNRCSTINRSTGSEDQKIKEPKRLRLTQQEGPGNFVGYSNLIGQEKFDVSV